MQLKPGRYLHKNCFKILHFIAEGGFGITYLAEETGYLKSTGFGEQYISNKNPEPVVIKELYFNDFCSRNEETGLVYVTNTNKKTEFEKLVNKQLEEGRIIKNLNHQNIVNTKDIFKENDTAYMVLEYIDGETIEEKIKEKGKFNQAEALKYINQVLSAVDYIHQKRILHLDITPSNILLKKNSDEVVLIDFGTSQTYGENNHIASTTSKLVVGFKKHYAPFEQSDINNLKEFDATFDTYAIGATFYFMLTGSPPPIASYILSGREKIIPPSQLNDSVNPNLDDVISQALSYRYPDRYKTALELSIAIEKAIDVKGKEIEEKEIPTELIQPENKEETVLLSENSYWNEAIEKNTIEGFNNYLQKYPNGKYKEQAAKRRDVLKKPNKDIPEIPTPKRSYVIYYAIGFIVIIILGIWLFSKHTPPFPPPQSFTPNDSTTSSAKHDTGEVSKPDSTASTPKVTAIKSDTSNSFKLKQEQANIDSVVNSKQQLKEANKQAKLKQQQAETERQAQLKQQQADSINQIFQDFQVLGDYHIVLTSETPNVWISMEGQASVTRNENNTINISGNFLIKADETISVRGNFNVENCIISEHVLNQRYLLNAAMGEISITSSDGSFPDRHEKINQIGLNFKKQEIQIRETDPHDNRNLYFFKWVK